MNYPRLKSLYANDPEMLRALELREQTDLLKEIASKNEVTMKGAEMIKGDKGDTPVKGVDYWTDEELSQIKDEITPVKGVHYFTPDDVEEVTNIAADKARPVKGVDYRDGIDADESKIASRLARLIPSKEDLLASIPKPEKLDREELTRAILAKVPKITQVTVEDVIKELKKSKVLETQDIKGLPNMNDQRWHGGGLTTVSHDATLTGTGTSSSPLSVVGGGVTVETPTGLVNSSNSVFTVSAQPKWIVSDGITYFSGAGYTYAALTVTLTIPPSEYIRAII
jgi:hypothetical protein